VLSIAEASHYIKAHMLHSSRSAMTLAHQEGAHVSFARSLVSAKNAEASIRKNDLVVRLDRAQAVLSKVQETYAFEIRYVTNWGSDAAALSPGAQRAHNRACDNYELNVVPCVERVDQLRDRIVKAEAAISKYTSMLNSLHML
jgi:hypothetical protein